MIAFFEVKLLSAEVLWGGEKDEDFGQKRGSSGKPKDHGISPGDRKITQVADAQRCFIKGRTFLKRKKGDTERKRKDR